MPLTDAQQSLRDGRLTASRVACLMRGDKKEIHNLWLELIGDPSFIPQDLSGVWPVQLGDATEPLHLNWIARKRGAISRRGEVVIHKCQWAAATLDGWLDSHQCPVECKHVGGFEKFDTIRQRYMPQLHWAMMVTGTPQCLFSVIEGAREPTDEFIPFDAAYGKELWARAELFMEHVNNLTPPVDMPGIEAPVKAIKEYDFSTNNSWCAAAADYLETKQAAERHEDAKVALKDQVPRDAQRAFGGGLELTRDKANRLRIGELKK